MNVLYLGFYITLFASGELATNPLVFLASFVNTMYDTLTDILTTNFLIRLREAAHASTHFSSAWLSTPCEGSPESLRFARADIDSSFGERQPVPIVEHAGYITGPEDMGRARRVDGQTETARQEK
ncbi:hypothetical protein TRAPUB_3965 [Trametes pubescens]|uniref:Uncharacterized protein n=1 Tax=Trametes pubescens TaxID=154538 RepID=A0A1M2VCH2_TRAPU|nr:hypothetical protein TRAPUB_3965 [Trametes pubescens]